MKDVLADDLIEQQNANWEKIEKCLNDNYRYYDTINDIKDLIRSTLETARTDLYSKQKEIKSLIQEEQPENAENS